MTLIDPDGMGRQPVNGEHREASGEEETTEEAGSCDFRIRPGMKLFDEYRRFVGELGEPRKPLSEEDRQRNRERRQRHHTKRWYEKQLLAIVNDEAVPAKERRGALLALGRSRGYHQPSSAKR